MIKRTIEISGRGNRLAARVGSLLIEQGGEEAGRVPLEDLGLLILDAPDTTYTHWTLVRAAEAGAVVVLCGRDHLPAALFLPTGGSLVAQRVAAQADAAKPLKKRLWQGLVRAKIRAQARVLGPRDERAAGFLRALVSTVRSGDPANVEARAARRYWTSLFGREFRRRRDGPPPNALLNYGYMALRASVARAVAGAGLHPALGLHHRHRANAFCLADDLLEPLRPMVDRRVRALVDEGRTEIDRDAKRVLLETLTEEVEVGGQRGPLLVGLERTVASLARCYEGTDRTLCVPTPCD